jgi:hypothetical protein
MRASFLALPVALVAMAFAAPALAQFGASAKPIYPRSMVMTMPIDVPAFATYRDFYAHVAKKRGLADPESSFAVEQIESHSTVEHLRDYSGAPVAVVRLDQPGTDGNYSFFVLREKENHICLLGEMRGRSYESSTSSGHLEFVLEAGHRTAQPVRYQVDGDFLIDVADLASLDRNDPIELDIRHGT